ncbi:hypothetical protein BT63DRAFT_370700 [Microthyrium microscopicum]|uniref:Uncharacterized protein n=1 Tax=Microthyrium microscopicum TaxID=703497 RepID=A0A6A6UIX0_9PEZI|nr:hypothetical protein BT63DRAFT_370700 [Microthyrium microscopicum]
MDALTEKPNWNAKIFDDKIVNKWKDEAAALPDGLLSEKAFEWCIIELRDRASDFVKDGFIRTYETESSVIKSDSTIPSELRDELRKVVELLLSVEDSEKDWHPNSNDQVLNLVHPSLYPLVYGQTRVLQTGQVGLLNCLASSGQGDIAAANQTIARTRQGQWLQSSISNEPLWSNRFQWLPAEVKFRNSEDPDDTAVHITSYINNLNPSLHQPLYQIIESVIAKSIPLWNQVLLSGHSYLSPRIRTYGAELDPAEPPDFGEDPDFTKVREYLREPDNPDYRPGFAHDEEHDEDDYQSEEAWLDESAIRWKWIRMRKVLHPEPGISFSYDQWKRGDTGNEKFRKQGLQVIVKLSSIELSPEKPEYAGGNWHLEGMRNEHIVATAIYYYDVENVSEARLRFRQESKLDDMNMENEQDDHQPLSVVFGTEGLSDEPAVQEIGSVATPGDRLLVFPNALQHKVEPFHLVDPTKKGHRRLLVLWLVDPHYRILSTANVPPQQQEWAAEAVKHGNVEKLPHELADMITKEAIAGMMSLEEAKRLRLELMAERTGFTNAVENNFETYNFCEH